MVFNRRLRWTGVRTVSKSTGTFFIFRRSLCNLSAKAHVRKVKIKSDGTADVPDTLYTIGIGKLLNDIDLVDDGLSLRKPGSSICSSGWLLIACVHFQFATCANDFVSGF